MKAKLLFTIVAGLLGMGTGARAETEHIDQADAPATDAPATEPACGSIKNWASMPPTEIENILADCGTDGAGALKLSKLEAKTQKCTEQEVSIARRNESARAEPRRVQSQRQCTRAAPKQQKAFKDPRCLVPLFPAPKKNMSVPKTAKVVIHHTGGTPRDTASGIRKHHVGTLGYNEVAYHYLISREPNGKWKVTETRPPWAEGAHVQATANKGSIAIAIAGNYQGSTELNGATKPQKNDTYPEPGAVAELAKLIKHIETKEAINISGFEGHDQALEKNKFCHKGCPGPGCAPLVNALNKWNGERAGKKAIFFEPGKWLFAARLLTIENLLAARKPAQQAPPATKDPDLDAAKSTLETYVTAYYAGDLRKLATTVDGEFIEATGGEAHWKKMLAATPKTKVALRNLDLERLHEVLLARFDVVEEKSGKVLESVPRTAAFILVKNEGQLRIHRVEMEALDLQ